MSKTEVRLTWLTEDQNGNHNHNNNKFNMSQDLLRQVNTLASDLIAMCDREAEFNLKSFFFQGDPLSPKLAEYLLIRWREHMMQSIERWLGLWC